MELLLTVEDHFLIKGNGLLVVTWFDYSYNRRFKPFSDEVVIRRPDGTEDSFLVSFAWGWGHGIGGISYSLNLIFPDGTKETVPIGSQIYVGEGVWKKLHGEVPNKLDSINS